MPTVYSGINLIALIVFSTLPKFVYTYVIVLVVTNNTLLFKYFNIIEFFFFFAITSLFIGVLGLFNERINVFRFIA